MPTTQCANCGEHQATTIFSALMGEEVLEGTAVCGECAERLEKQALGPVGPLAPTSILSRMKIDPEEPNFICADCGYDVEDLVRTGKLGCKQCYLSFEEEVMNLVKRHIGREVHRGKMPPLRPHSSSSEPPA